MNKRFGFSSHYSEIKFDRSFQRKRKSAFTTSELGSLDQ